MCPGISTTPKSHLVAHPPSSLDSSVWEAPGLQYFGVFVVAFAGQGGRRELRNGRCGMAVVVMLRAGRQKNRDFSAKITKISAKITKIYVKIRPVLGSFSAPSTALTKGESSYSKVVCSSISGSIYDSDGIISIMRL